MINAFTSMDETKDSVHWKLNEVFPTGITLPSSTSFWTWQRQPQDDTTCAVVTCRGASACPVSCVWARCASEMPVGHVPDAGSAFTQIARRPSLPVLESCAREAGASKRLTEQAGPLL